MLHDWCNKNRGMCYLVCGLVHIKKNLGANRKEYLIIKVNDLLRQLMPNIGSHLSRFDMWTFYVHDIFM